MIRIRYCVVFLGGGAVLTTAEMTEEHIQSLVENYQNQSTEVIHCKDEEGDIYIKPVNITALCVNDSIHNQKIGL